jgi:hypothetical protein
MPDLEIGQRDRVAASPDCRAARGPDRSLGRFEGGRKVRLARLMRVQETSEDKFWTAKEWAMKTRMPYRSILAAAARGELSAVRPSGTAHGAILISEASWAAWLERNSLAAPASRVRRVRPGAKQLGDFALR